MAQALCGFGTGRKYLNFAEQATDPASFETPQTRARLQGVKAEVDLDPLSPRQPRDRSGSLSECSP
jgi:hypothetical protein